MAYPESLIEDDASVHEENFVEVNYDDLIPNNVDLSSRTRLTIASAIARSARISRQVDGAAVFAR